LNYLGHDYDAKYKARLAIPKLIISASGDDFFTPDSSQFYFHKLPGEQNHIRFLPNSMHYFRGNAIADNTRSFASINDAIDHYFSFIIHNTQLPQSQWSFTKDSILLSTTAKPKTVKLWTAFNDKARDFRYVNNHSTFSLLKKKLMTYLFSEVCDTCYEEQDVAITCHDQGACKLIVLLPQKDYPTWRAAFLEVTHEVEGKEFTTSSEVGIEHLQHLQKAQAHEL
jgi:hypothetical protein